MYEPVQRGDTASYILQRLMKQIELAGQNARKTITHHSSYSLVIRSNFLLYNGQIVKDQHMVVPTLKKMINLIHTGNLGIEQIKNARESLFWPGVNNKHSSK